MANSASTRSRGVSPMPMRMPVVKGMPSLPARRDGARGAGAGTLSGAWSCACPAPSRRSDTRLQHDAHAHVDLAQRGQIALAHEPGIGVGQERRLLQRERAHRAQIAERGAVPVAREELAVLREARLRLVAEGEQRLLGAEAAAGLHERHDLVGGHRARAGLAGIAPERAVAAVVAAQRGERDEDLRREGHGAPAPAIAQLAGPRQQIRQRLAPALDQLTRGGVRDHRLPLARGRPCAGRRAPSWPGAARAARSPASRPWRTVPCWPGRRSCPGGSSRRRSA